MTPVELIVLGGYLGAGKTTVLNALLTQPHGRRVAVMVNDFGEVNIDARLVRAQSDDLIELQNGCICCSIGGALVEALTRVAARSPRPDVLLIEASGVSDPGRIAQIGLVGRDFRLQGIVVMVDACGLDATLAHPLVGDMAREQIAAATVLAVTKLDLLPEAAHAPIFAKLASLARTRLIVAADHGVVAPELVFGTVAAPARGDELRLKPWQIPRRLNLRSVCVRLDGPVRKAALKAFLKSLPGTVLRAKGIVRLDHDSGLYSCHAVGGRVALSRIEDEQALADESPVLVFIGDFDAQAEHELADAARALQRDEVPPTARWQQ
ncbi:Putative metal chaperone, involved in Zn homeostasis, GTPase of COG0523 family [Caballeronia glathei]|jgi:G3E family GTPase|uniref:Cobalamin biosynthesis protein n=1 Tax=Caballeronia glathei TaxID=60547 RepID=A0A069PLJ5_9BURK|nr:MULTISPECIES: GTP-binding protein [Burkholderiaceae]KDR41302.1 cobalamin biosynthesis protein [Caballeronia glathei]TCK39339.1 G3E family GTPase [Paraburkholderia sp. BL8N3]CDY78480.1 Putative metal chaperone, involved in Zn homeostasis, GTPase of COG0523 family [Caballeronia glathei]